MPTAPYLTVARSGEPLRPLYYDPQRDRYVTREGDVAITTEEFHRMRLAAEGVSIRRGLDGREEYVRCG